MSNQEETPVNTGQESKKLEQKGDAEAKDVNEDVFTLKGKLFGKGGEEGTLNINKDKMEEYVKNFGGKVLGTVNRARRTIQNIKTVGRLAGRVDSSLGQASRFVNQNSPGIQDTVGQTN